MRLTRWQDLITSHIPVGLQKLGIRAGHLGATPALSAGDCSQKEPTTLRDTKKDPPKQLQLCYSKILFLLLFLCLLFLPLLPLFPSVAKCAGWRQLWYGQKGGQGFGPQILPSCPVALRCANTVGLQKHGRCKIANNNS